MSEITTIGLDLAKRVFQVHGVDAQGTTVWPNPDGGRLFEIVDNFGGEPLELTSRRSAVIPKLHVTASEVVIWPTSGHRHF